MNIQAAPPQDDASRLAAARPHPVLEAFLRPGPPDHAAVAAFLASTPLPLVEPGALTFLWQGDADGVEVLRWIHAGVDRNALHRLPGTDLWALRLPVENDGRFEYKLNVVRGGHDHWMLDPHNPERAGDPFGENSVAMTYGYRRPDWSRPNGAPRGQLVPLTVLSRIFGASRTEQVYLPAAYDPDTPHPLLIVHDGGDYASYADLTVSLDNLIAQGDVPPLIAVLIQADDRLKEYPRGRRHARYLVGELLPRITGTYAIAEDPGKRVLLGASLGAVASLSTAFRFPGVFGGLILKSGSFILDPERLRHRPHPVFQHVARLVQAMQRAPALPPTRAYVSTGELEGLADDNRALADFLRTHDVDVKFQSSWDGHHWHNWRDQLRDALIWVLGARNDD